MASPQRPYFRSIVGDGPSREILGVPVPVPGWLARFADWRPCDPDVPENWSFNDHFNRVVQVDVSRDSHSEWSHQGDVTWTKRRGESLEQAVSKFAELQFGVRSPLFESIAGVRGETTHANEWSRSIEHTLTLESWVRTTHRRWRQRKASFTVEINRCCPAPSIESEYQTLLLEINSAQIIRSPQVPKASSRDDPDYLCERIVQPFQGCLWCSYELGRFLTYSASRQTFELRNPKDDNVWMHASTPWEPKHTSTGPYAVGRPRRSDDRSGRRPR